MSMSNTWKWLWFLWVWIWAWALIFWLNWWLNPKQSVTWLQNNDAAVWLQIGKTREQINNTFSVWPIDESWLQTIIIQPDKEKSQITQKVEEKPAYVAEISPDIRDQEPEALVTLSDKPVKKDFYEWEMVEVVYGEWTKWNRVLSFPYSKKRFWDDNKYLAFEYTSLKLDWVSPYPEEWGNWTLLVAAPWVEEPWTDSPIIIDTNRPYDDAKLLALISKWIPKRPSEDWR